MARRERLAVVAAFAGAVLSFGACEPCAGTIGCHNFSKVSYSGRFIERATGKYVSGVRVEFARDSGRELAVDPIVDVSDDDGFFKLETGTYGDGSVWGRLIVTPPAHPAYTVADFRLDSRIVKGDGVYAGRLVVDPYVYFLGEVFDRRSGRGVPNARVTLGQTSGVLVSPTGGHFTTDELGRFLFTPTISTYGPSVLEVTINAPGDPETYFFLYTLKPEYLHRDPAPTLLRYPRLFQYSVEVSRRGTGEFLPGVEVAFVRTGGVAVSPESISTTFAAGQGRLLVVPTAEADGEVLAKLIIRPPAPHPAETLSLKLPTHYYDTLFLAGPFGWGPSVNARVQLIDRSTGRAAAGGEKATFRRVGGLPLVQHPASAGLDNGLRLTDSLGRAPYIVGAPDTGVIVFDVAVQVRGLQPETLRSVSLPARRSDSALVVGPYRAGGWFPWYVEVRDSETDAPIAGARVGFQPSSGIDPRFYADSTGADGRVTIRGVPRKESLRGRLFVRFPSGTHRDTTLHAVTLRTMYDDTLRLLRVVRATRTAP